MITTSNDNGHHWSEPKPLENGILGPIKNKPIELSNGTILSPSSTENQGWQVHVEISNDKAVSWKKTDPLNDSSVSVIQPTLLRFSDDRIQMLMRNQKRNSSTESRITESWSFDGGITWSPLKPTTLPNPNSAIDGVVLRDGRAVLVYNDSIENRSNLHLAISEDQGRTWANVYLLENEPGMEFSYPAVIQTPDGLIHLTYTWKRKRIKQVVFDPSKLQPKKS